MRNAKRYGVWCCVLVGVLVVVGLACCCALPASAQVTGSGPPGDLTPGGSPSPQVTSWSTWDTLFSGFHRTVEWLKGVCYWVWSSVWSALQYVLSMGQNFLALVGGLFETTWQFLKEVPKYWFFLVVGMGLGVGTWFLGVMGACLPHVNSMALTMTAGNPFLQGVFLFLPIDMVLLWMASMMIVMIAYIALGCVLRWAKVVR